MIYILQCERSKSLKIGYSANPKGRIATLRTASPDRLRFIGLIEGDVGEERRIHRDLQRHRLAGEWFEGNAEVAAYLDELLRTRSGSRPYCRAMTGGIEGLRTRARGPPREADRPHGRSH